MPRTKKKRFLTQQEIYDYLAKFMVSVGYTDKDLSKNFDKVKTEFFAWLETQNVDTDKIELTKIIKTSEPIHKISEELNERYFDFCVYTDTTTIIPGLVCYEVEKVEATPKKPYVTYKPSPRVIVSVHNNGVNGGTLFMTYSHKVSNKFDFNSSEPQVISEYEVIYSPLTKGHAEYICRLLNLQSKQMYKQALLKSKKQKAR